MIHVTIEAHGANWLSSSHIQEVQVEQLFSYEPPKLKNKPPKIMNEYQNKNTQKIMYMLTIFAEHGN